MDPVFELAITLPCKGSRDLLRELHRQFRAAILDGRLRPGLRLPATRALATALGISRNTAIATYDLLLSGGYLANRPGTGTYVANVVPQLVRPKTAPRSVVDSRLAAFWRAPPAPQHASLGISYRFDFRLGAPDTTLFPFHVWRRLSARALRGSAIAPAGYAEPEGRPELREAIARHVSFTRAVACGADDIVVTAGAQQAFDLLSRILVTPRQTVVATEEPGYPPLRAAFAAAGAHIVPVPVDGEGMVVDQLPANTRVIYVTPSHQFPLGVVMSPRRRAALLDFARASGAVVIEDDYDSEFRFAGRPLDALQTLDRSDTVFYVGTFSKSLFPELRLGFVVAPPWARRALISAKQISDWHNPVLVQDTLAAFIAEGHLARHVRKMRRVYADRRAILLRVLAQHCGDRLQPIPAVAGLHLAARLTVPVKASVFVASAADAGIGIEALDRYAVGNLTENGLAFAYGMIGAEHLDEAVHRLALVMNQGVS